jgi:hypothetical protein
VKPEDIFTRLFPTSLWIPGAFHILHTSCSDLTDAMKHFKDKFLPHLRHLTEFLSHRHWRERFISQCLLTEAALPFRDLFEDLSLSLAEWRWGSMLYCTRKILERMTPLRVFFDRQAMEFKGDGGRGGGDGGALDERQFGPDANDRLDMIQKVNAAIHDRFFWSFASMLNEVGQVVKDFQMFFFSCSCHPEKTEAASRGQFNTIRPCPMMGRIGPDMATGAWKAKLSRMFDRKSAGLLGHTYELSPEEREWVLQDFGNARARLLLTLQLKFSFWESIPHKLVGAAHDDLQLASSTFRECLLQLAVLKQERNIHRIEDLAKVHPLIAKLELWRHRYSDDVQAFVQGEPPRGVLQDELAKLRLVMVIELSIESKHALAKGRVRGQAASPAMFSTEMRFPEIRRRLSKSDAEVFLNFVGNFGKLRNMLQLAGLFNLVGHPAIQDSFTKWQRCMYTYICIHICMHIYIYMYRYIHTNVYVSIYRYIGSHGKT